jgi:2-aminoadipate transaminase
MGMTLSLERRKRMLEVAQRYGIPILENESYADFRIDGPPLLPAMAGMDGGDTVMYVSAYTKLLGCGLRLGFGVVPGAVMKALARLRFGGAPSHLASMAVHGYMTRHGERHIQAVAESLRAKRDALLSALSEHFPDTCAFSRPSGGMMVWVRLGEGADTWRALDRAVEAGVKYNPGPVFRAGRDCRNYLRLTYSHNSPEEIREGVAILAGVFRREGLFDK